LNSLPKKLKSLRKERRWTLNEVAEKLELRGHSTYSNWEYGRTEPDTEMLKKIAGMYAVSLDYLLDRTDDPSVNLSEDAKKILDIADLIDIHGPELEIDVDLELDGKILTKEELLRFIAFLRTERQMKDLL
jgi:transcriptional regulator with XRE-family HTH domain